MTGDVCLQLCKALQAMSVRKLDPETANVLIKIAQQLTAARNGEVKAMAMLAKLARKVPELNMVPLWDKSALLKEGVSVQ